jgi:hypothetical protein
LDNDNNDSDLDPTEKPNDTDLGGGSSAVNPTQVQLTTAQMEEVKLMTQGKMRQFRRDRLYASDRERLAHFNILLKTNRISDDQQNCVHCNPSLGNDGKGSKTNGGKNWDHNHNKGGSPSKISPTKQSQGTKFNDSSHTNNG